MKDSYQVLESGFVRVLDFNKYGKCSEYLYNFQDNIEELLKEENIKEYLEQELKKLEKEIFDNESVIKRNKQINLALGLSVIAVTIFFGFLSYNLQINNMIAGSWKIITCGSGLLGLTMATPLIWFANRCNRKFSNIVNGCKFKCEEIKKHLDKTNDNIKKLQNNKSNSREEEMKKIPGYLKVDSIEQLNNLRNYLFNFYSLGLHEKELSEYYRQGTLDKVLEETYDEDEIAIIKKHFEEKGPTLVKRRKT